MSGAGLTGVLADIARATSTGVALKLAAEVGGTEIFVAMNPGPRHALAKLVGVENARAIATVVGHGRMLIPMAGERGQAGRRRQVAELIGGGKSVTEAARQADVHEKTVRRVKKKMRSPLPLFER